MRRQVSAFSLKGVIMAATRHTRLLAIFIPIAAAIAVLAILTTAALNHAVPLTQLHRTVRGLGGDVTIEAPPHTHQNLTKVKFTRTGYLPEPAYGLLPQAMTLAQPVDLHVERGGFEPGRIKVTMKLPDGLHPDAYKFAYIAVFEPGLGQLVPLMDSRPDPAKHTVTASAPHFSTYQALVNTVKEVGDRIIDIDWLSRPIWMPLIPALNEAVKQMQKEAYRSFLGLGPDVDCDNPSETVKVKVKDRTWGQLVEACAEDYDDDSGKTHINIANHFAFPMVFKAPKGFKVGAPDFDLEDGTVPQLISHLLYMNVGKAVAPGPGLAHFTMKEDADVPAMLEGKLSWGPVAADLAYYVVSFLNPAVKASKSEIKSALKEVKASFGKDAAAMLKNPAETLNALAKKHPELATFLTGLADVTTVADCAYNGVRLDGQLNQVLDQGKTLDNVDAKAGAILKYVWDCAKSLLVAKASALTQFMAALTSELRVFPMLLHTLIVGLVQKFNIDLSEVILTVSKVATAPRVVLVGATVYSSDTAQLTVTSYTFKGNRLFVQWFYDNKMPDPVELPCPVPVKSLTWLHFGDKQIWETSGFCSKYPNGMTLQPNEKLGVYSEFKVDRSQVGQSFEFAWYRLGVTSPILLRG
jgi:hypothetical protein